jgi:Regulator of polyketide synthase expression
LWDAKGNHDFLEIYRKFHAVMDRPGFGNIVKCASEIFDAPVVFTNEEYHIVAQYPLKKIGDSVYDTLLESGTLPIDTIMNFQKAYLEEDGPRYDPFFANKGLVEDMPRIFAEVYDDIHIYGHIAIFINKNSVEPWQLEAASILVSVLRIKVKLSQDYAPSLSSDLNILLNRNSPDSAKSSAVLNLSRFYKKPGILLTAPFGRNKAQQALLSFVHNPFKKRFSGAVSTLFKTDLVSLVLDEKKHSLSEMKSVAQEMSNFLSRYEIYCGAVYPVENLYLLPDYYLQSHLTADLVARAYKNSPKEKVPHLSYYDRGDPMPLYLFISQQPGFSCFIDPLLKTIEDYDIKNNTELLSTLKCYCESLFNKNHTAEKLHIHRNTLTYRLNRIEELFHIDLQDYNCFLDMMISFELSEFL